MNERTPITKAEELDALDDRDVQAGYWAGRNNREEPGVEFNRDFWHGWRNGMIDFGHMKGDAASAALARDVIDSGWLREIGRELRGGRAK